LNFTLVKLTYDELMTDGTTMKDLFEPRQHLTSCFELPTREPEAYYRPDRKRVTPYFSNVCVLVEHETEVQELKKKGVPHFLAQVMVLVEYAHTEPGLEKRAKEAQRQ
jgi:hypothetical protein